MYQHAGVNYALLYIGIISRYLYAWKRGETFDGTGNFYHLNTPSRFARTILCWLCKLSLVKLRMKNVPSGQTSMQFRLPYKQSDIRLSTYNQLTINIQSTYNQHTAPAACQSLTAKASTRILTTTSFSRSALPASRVCISQLPACASPSFSRASITWWHTSNMLTIS